MPPNDWTTFNLHLHLPDDLFSPSSMEYEGDAAAAAADHPIRRAGEMKGTSNLCVLRIKLLLLLFFIPATDGDCGGSRRPVDKGALLFSGD